MSGTLEKLFSEILGLDNLLFAVGETGSYVSECFLTPEARQRLNFRISGGWLTLETPGWHIHINSERLKGVKFVEKTREGGERKTLAIHFLDVESRAVLRVYLRDVYDESGKPVAPRIEVYEKLKERYGNLERGLTG